MQRQPADSPTVSSPVVEGFGAVAASGVCGEYPRLVRLAYLLLPASYGRRRRVLAAHAVARRALPRGREAVVRVPRARRPEEEGGAVDAAYALARARVVRGALRGRLLPSALPRVWGLRVFPRPGGSGELALDQRLSELSGPGRAVCVLRGLEGLDDARVRDLLAAAGVADPAAAVAEADAVPARELPGELFLSSGFDACSLQVRPPDPDRRGRRLRAGAAALAALAVCGTLLALPGTGGDGRPDDAARALTPESLTRVSASAWEASTRRDFSVWPVRGTLTEDTALLGRALAMWAEPSGGITVSATPGTPSGPPAGPAQLLFAGEVGRARVVLLHDGLRIVRYAESLRPGGASALDFARTDGADAASAAALVAGRTGGSVRYLTAPWVREVSVRDLLDPDARPRPLGRDSADVTEPLRTVGREDSCEVWETLRVEDADGATRLLTDLGELAPARLTFGPPDAARDADGTAARAVWARAACSLTALRSHGVREVNGWAYARQRLPEANGTAVWLCTRGETWRGPGNRVMAQFLPPPARPAAPATVVARAQGTPACGVRRPRVLAGVLWQSQAGQWYALAAGGGPYRSLRLSGGVTGEGEGPTLAVRAREGARAGLDGELADGTREGALR
ncbi:hypothetical protein [Streptomyces sp. NPDC005805]|uniref:hypothetical protein n=1 Tax=Streptomyces sp. NPDC005805 TaxID=3157068 RepID=UPI0034072229